MSARLKRLVPTVIRRRYALKFVLVMLLVGVAVGVTGYVATGQLADRMEQVAQDDQETLVEQEAQNVRNWDDRNRLIATSIATNVENGDASTALSDAENDHVGIQAHVLDLEDGVVENSSNGNYIDREVESIDDSWTTLFDGTVSANDLYSGAVFLGVYETDVPAYDSGDETPVAAYAAEVDGDRIAVFEANLELDADTLVDREGQLSYLVLAAGNESVVMMDPRGESFIEPYETVTRWTQVGETDVRSVGAPSGSLADSVNAYSSGGYGDDRYLAATTRVSSELPWHVVVHTPESQAYGIAQNVQTYGVYASLAGLLLVALVGGVVGRNTALSIDRLTAKAERMEDGDLEVEFETDRVDNIGRLYGGFGNMRDALAGQIEEAEGAKREAEESSEAAERARKAAEESQTNAERERERAQQMNDRLERTADEYAAVMREAAEGDLTVRTDPDSDDDAMAAIGHEFDAMLAELESTVADLIVFAKTVETASREVTHSSEEVEAAAGRVSESVQEISDGADRQNDHLHSATATLSNLSSATEEIAASSTEVVDLAERTAETSDEGRETAERALAGMERIETESERATTEIRRLEEEVERVDDLIDSIGSIADQTNMLALNATIEATRAGGENSGAGFEAVAAEIKELSQEAKSAAEEIETRLESIRDKTARSTEVVELTSDEISAQVDAVRETATALAEISERAQETTAGVQDISAATDQQAASTQNVAGTIDETAAISDDVAAEARSVAAAAEEQSASSTETASSASALAEQASTLSAALERFETNVGPNSIAGAESDTESDAVLSDTESDPILSDTGIDTRSADSERELESE